jgi:hypothetical protein
MKHLLLLSVLLVSRAVAQPILDHPLTIECRQQPLGQVLETLAAKGGFYFSYAGDLFNKDSLVTLPPATRTVRQLLDTLFKGRLHYREDGHYLILLPAPPKPSPPVDNKHFTITGTIFDETTGERLGQASVYDPDQLFATLSREDGSFVLRVKARDRPIILIVSKEFYIDTTILLQDGAGSRHNIPIAPVRFSPKAYPPLPSDPRDSIIIGWNTDSARVTAILSKDLIRVELTAPAKFLLSTRLKIQSVNLGKFFVRRPIQLSLVPGLSTNGPLNSQVVNKFSMNLVGGYSAGLTGVELGGVFNIDKRGASGFQAAGVFNLVGDSVSGVQLAGVFNKDLDTIKAFQVAGVANSAKHLDGIQMAGVFNTARSVDGAQLAGAVNYTKHLKGFQLGIVNIADTSDGVSIGLVNIVRNGIHELSVYADEWSTINIAFRSGSKKLYGILLAGVNPDVSHRSYYFGYGFGHPFTLTQKLALRPELSYLQVSPANLQHFDKNRFVTRLNLDLHWQVTKQFAISAGPSFAVYYPDQDYYIGGKLYQPLPRGYSTFSLSGRTIGWIGWRAAVNFF